MKRIFAFILVLLMAAVMMPAAAPVAVKTDWNGFLAQVAEQKLKNRGAWITLRSGERIKLFVVGVTDEGLVVTADHKTREWAAGKGKALVPRSVVQGVQFTGRAGRKAMIGGLAGLGAGGAVTAAVASGAGGDSDGGSTAAIGAVLMIPVASVAGYFIGRSMDKPAPAFTFE